MREKDISKIIDLAVKELKTNKKKWFVDTIIDAQGQTGLVYEALENMLYHGRYMYPNTYKYRKELSRYYKRTIRETAKRWESK